jgi:hypothetical protein
MKRSALPLRASSRSLPRCDRGIWAINCRSSRCRRPATSSAFVPAETFLLSVIVCRHSGGSWGFEEMGSVPRGAARSTTQGPHHPGERRRCPGVQMDSAYARSGVSRGHRATLPSPARGSRRRQAGSRNVLVLAGTRNLADRSARLLSLQPLGPGVLLR